MTINVRNRDEREEKKGDDLEMVKFSFKEISKEMNTFYLHFENMRSVVILLFYSL